MNDPRPQWAMMMTYLRTVFAAIGICALPTASVIGADLVLERAFPFAGPSGLAYDARFCGLWVANETGEVALVNLHGDELRRFSVGLRRIDALAIEDGDLLLTDGGGRYQRASIDGEVLGPPFRMGAGVNDNDGLFVDPVTHETWVTDDSRAEVLRIGASGDAVAHVVGIMLTTPLMEPQGITRDPLSGNFLVVDDADALDALFEFAGDGTLLDVIPLARGAVADAEAITIQPETGTVFVGFDDTDTIAVYHYTPTPGASEAAEPGPSRCLVSQAGAPPPHG